MTDLLDRTSRPLLERSPAPSAHRRPQGLFDLSTAGRVLLATLSGAAGVIHLAMVPSHAGVLAVEGVSFAVAGWFQLLVAMLLVTRPARSLLRLTMVANLALIAAWVT